MKALHARFFKQRICKFKGKRFPALLVIFNLKRVRKLKGLATLILQACLGSRTDASMLRGTRGGIGWNILSSLMQLFAFLAAILNVKLEEAFEDCAVNQLLQSMAILTGSMLLK